jgi:DNA end-binding protein Ku
MAKRASKPTHSAGGGTARSIDSASIVFGLVSIPIKIYSTTEPGHEIHFHMIHAGCGERLKQQYICPKHGVVERSDMAKGYQVDRSKMIELDPKELDALDAVANDEIALTEFVPVTEIDPIYVDRTYYLGPDKGGDRPYRLLRDALEKAKLVGVASYAARGKAYLVMVRPFENGLAMHQLRYPDEIKPWKAVGLHELAKPTAQELDLAGKLIEQLTHDAFDPSAYKDEVKGRVKKLLAERVKTGETIEMPEAETAPKAVPDLMAALRASLGGKTEATAAKPAKPTKAHPARTKHATKSAHARPRASAKRAAPQSARSRHGAHRAAS